MVLSRKVEPKSSLFGGLSRIAIGIILMLIGVGIVLFALEYNETAIALYLWIRFFMGILAPKWVTTLVILLKIVFGLLIGFLLMERGEKLFKKGAKMLD